MESQRFLRISRLIGDQALDRLSHSFVVIVGLGAVGGYAMEALARSGIGHFRLVDFDTVGITNINRQILATESTLGKKKVTVAKERILDINNEAIVESCDLFAHEESLDQIFAGSPDIIIDAIDSLAPKLALLEGAWKQNIVTISSMGAALRRDPSKIACADLMDTKGCPLARQVRAKLKRRGVGRGIVAIYSTEKVDYEYKDPEEETQAEYNEQILDRGRKRKVLGSLPTITGIFGLTAANEAINQLVEEK